MSGGPLFRWWRGIYPSHSGNRGVSWRHLLTLGLVATVSILLGGMTTSQVGATSSSGLAISESTTTTSFDAANPTISLGFLVTDTGSTFLQDVQVTDTLGATVNCPSSTLGVGDAETCTASVNASTYVTAGQVSDAATVTADDYGDNAVSASTAEPAITVTTPPAQTTPLLPTPLSTGSSPSTPLLELQATAPCDPMNAVDAYASSVTTNGSGSSQTREVSMDPTTHIDGAMAEGLASDEEFSGGVPTSDQWGNAYGPAKYVPYGGAQWANPGYGCDATASLTGTPGTSSSVIAGCNTNLEQYGCGTTNGGVDWKLTGTDSSNKTTTCTQDSAPPTAHDVPGVLCLGSTQPQPAFQSQPVVTIGVPTANVQMPLQCANQWNPPASYTPNDGTNFSLTSGDNEEKNADNSKATNDDGNTGIGLDGTHTVCKIQAEASTDGSVWTPVGNPLFLDSTANGGKGTLTIPLDHGAQFVSLFYTFYIEDNGTDFGLPGVGVGDAAQLVGISCETGAPCGSIGSNFCLDAPASHSSGTAQQACAGTTEALDPDYPTTKNLSNDTIGAEDVISDPDTGGSFGPAVGVTPALEVDVEPTAEFQADAVLNRIVYAPPGVAGSSGSYQTYTQTQGGSTTTDLTVGQSSSNVTSTDKSLTTTVTASAGLPWASVNISYSTGWDQSQSNNMTSGTSTDTQSEVSTSISSALTAQAPTSPLGPGSDTDDPGAPAWMNDVLDVLVNPTFAAWDFASCGNGAAAAQESDDSTSCPTSPTPVPVTGSTGVTPISYDEEVAVPISQLVPCVEGTGSYAPPGQASWPQSQCRALVAQDPFAATALGVVPTPEGQVPGQGVNPAKVLGSNNSSPYEQNTWYPNSSGNFDFDTSKVNSYATTASSSMEADVTNVSTNEVAIGGSLNVSTPVFNASGGTSVDYKTSSTNTYSLTENYSGTVSTDQLSGFDAHANIAPESSTPDDLSVWWDARFDTWMFQDGGATSTDSGPAISSVVTTTAQLATSLGNGLPVTSLSVSGLPDDGIQAGQSLELPDGQLAETTAAAPPTATTLQIQPFTPDQTIGVGAIKLIDEVTISGTGFFTGPAQVNFCTGPTSASSSSCSTDSSPVVDQHAGGALIYASVPNLPQGTTIGVQVQTQSGPWSTAYPSDPNGGAVSPSVDDAGSLYTYDTPGPAGNLAQTVTFTSTPPTSGLVYGDYIPTARSSSGLPVQITLDQNSSGCFLNGGVVYFVSQGTCLIDATQGGNWQYLAAPMAQQSIAISLNSQTVTITSAPPSPAFVGETYTPIVTDSAILPVTITPDSSSTGCSVSGRTVSFTAAGTCVVDAIQPGNAGYLPAEAQQSIPVSLQTQTVSFKTAVPDALVGQTYVPKAVATSGLPVKLALDPSSKGCKLKAGTVKFTKDGLCVIDASQGGNSTFAMASAQQSLPVTVDGLSGPDAVSADGSHVWVANQSGDSVTEFDGSTGALVRVITSATGGFAAPDAIDSDGTYVWVANYDSNSVTMIDASTGAVVSVINASKDKVDEPVAISSDKSHVWVANAGNNSVTMLNATSGALVKVLDAPHYYFDGLTAIDSDGTHVWVASAVGSVTEMNASTGAFKRVYPHGDTTTPDFGVPDAIVSTGTNVFVASATNNDVTEMSIATGAVVSQQSMRGIAYGYGPPTALAYDGSSVWVAESGGYLTQLDGTSGDLISIAPQDPEGSPSFTSVSADGSHEWVTDSHDNAVAEFDTSPALVTVISR